MPLLCLSTVPPPVAGLGRKADQGGGRGSGGRTEASGRRTPPPKPWSASRPKPSKGQGHRASDGKAEETRLRPLGGAQRPSGQEPEGMPSGQTPEGRRGNRARRTQPRSWVGLKVVRQSEAAVSGSLGRNRRVRPMAVIGGLLSNSRKQTMAVLLYRQDCAQGGRSGESR